MTMGPVHAVLANSDLLTMVFPAKANSKDEQNELFHLALVCRKFSTVALEILWKAVYNIDQICCLFPKDTVYTSPANTKSFSRTPVTCEQWTRFETYAWRVRTIRVYHAGDPDRYMVLGRHPSRRHPFPHLTHLRWAIDIDDVSRATLILSSTLADISFHLNGDGPDDAMADTIQAVKETCTHLREFKYSHDGEFIITSKDFETSLDSLIRSSPYLQKISVPTNCPVLDALALLPSLTRIDLSEPSDRSDDRWNSIDSAVPQSPDQGTFVALERLNIWSTFTSVDPLHLFLEPFQKMVSKPQVHLRLSIDSDDPDSFPEIPQHLYDAISPNLRLGLEVFQLYQNRDPDVIAPVYSWKSFNWLLASPHLRSLMLGNYSLKIDDTAFAQMVQKWPELQNIHLVISDRSVDPHVPFRGLAHLSLLPKLQLLCMTIGPNCTITPSLLYCGQVSTSPVREVRLQGEFPNADAFQVALFLIRHFPNLKLIQKQPELQWQEVKWRMAFLRKVLPKIPEGRAWLNSDK